MPEIPLSVAWTSSGQGFPGTADACNLPEVVGARRTLQTDGTAVARH